MSRDRIRATWSRTTVAAVALEDVRDNPFGGLVQPDGDA